MYNTNCDVYYWKESGITYRLPNLSRNYAYDTARKLSLDPEIIAIRIFAIRVLDKLPLRTDLRTYQGKRHE